MDAISSVGTPTVLTPAVFVSPTSVSGTAPSAEPAAATAPAPETPYSQNRDRYKELVDIILNRSGSFSLDERLKAYSDQFEMGVKGQLYCGGVMDADHEFYKIQDQVSNTDICLRMQQLTQQCCRAVQAALSRGEDVGITALKWFASLSEDDQKIYFTSQNSFDMAGNRQYVDFDHFRDVMVKREQSAAAYKGKSPALAEGLKTIAPSQSGADWSAQILALLKTIDPKELLSDKPYPRFLLDLMPPVPSIYEPGNLMDRVA